MVGRETRAVGPQAALTAAHPPSSVPHAGDVAQPSQVTDTCTHTRNWRAAATPARRSKHPQHPQYSYHPTCTKLHTGGALTAHKCATSAQNGGARASPTARRDRTSCAHLRHTARALCHHRGTTTSYATLTHPTQRPDGKFRATPRLQANSRPPADLRCSKRDRVL